MLDHVGEVLDAIVDADGEELCYHYRVFSDDCLIDCDKRGGHSRSARKARGRQRSHQHSALPQSLTGSQRKLFSEFSRRSCETGAVLLLPPLFLPSYANRAWWRLVVPLTGLEYERHSMPSMTLPRFIISNGESDQMISHDEVARGAR